MILPHSPPDPQLCYPWFMLGFNTWENKQIDVSFSCVCPVIDDKFCHNFVKAVVDQQGDNQVDPQTMTMLWQNWLSITGQTHEKLISMTNCLLLPCINYKFMCLSAYWHCKVLGGRRSGPMVSAFDSGASGPGSSPGRGHCVVFLGKKLHSHSASLHPGVWGPANLTLGVTLRWTSIPSQGGVEILSVASCYGNRDKLRPDGPLGSNADFTKGTGQTVGWYLSVTLDT